jgi:hypothetical protein
MGLRQGPIGVPADIRGVELVEWTSRSDAGEFKRAFAKCPDGKRVLGGGGRVFVASGADEPRPAGAAAPTIADDIGLSVSVPSREMDGWAVTAQAMHPAARRTNWFVTASAVCADATGLEPVQWSTASDAASLKRAFARCPAGSRVLGGGGRVFVPSDDGREPAESTAFARKRLPDYPIALGLSAPSEDMDGWAITAQAMHPKARRTNWFATASAVCAEVAGLQVVQWSSLSSNDDFKRAFAKCPDGTKVLAGGGRVFQPPSRDGRKPAEFLARLEDEIGLTVSAPSADRDGWAVTAQAMHPRASKAEWFVTASAVCAPLE